MQPTSPPTLPKGVSPEDLDRLLRADLASLGALEVGVATSSFQTEGGLDGPGEPETNWARWQREGRVERIGGACELWRRFDQVAARCRAMSLDVFRLSVEWARLCPSGERLDPRAVEGYAARLCALRDAGVEPIVTLQHFTHPAWAGVDLWLDERSVDLFARYAAQAAEALGDALVRRGHKPLARLLTINEPNMLAVATYLAGVFPHGRAALAQGDPLGVPRTLRALDHLMAAHVRAYRAVHAAYRARGWPAPDVSWNLNALDVYGLSKLLFDLLRAPSRGVAAAGLARYVAAERARYLDALCDGEQSPRTRAARALEDTLARVLAPELFATTLRALYELPGAPAVDSLAVDVYDPWSYQQLRGGDALFEALAAGAPLATLPALLPEGVRLAEPWEWVCEPLVLTRVLRAMHSPEAPLPIDVMENGMALRRDPRGACEPRADGVTRPEFVRGYTFAAALARAAHGVPVRTYCHWTLVDNYELGRYAPRFGLYALPDPPSPRRAGPWGETDAADDDAAGALAGFARAIAAGRSEPGALGGALGEYFGAAPR